MSKIQITSEKISNESNISISYKVQGIGYPTLLMHGLGANNRQILSTFSATNARIWSPDLPGHGHSDNFQNAYCFAKFKEIMIAFLDSLQIEKVILGGISMGSGIAINMAESLSDRVAGLIICRPAWLDKQRPDNLQIISDIGNWLQNKTLEQAKFELSRNLQFQDLLKTNPNCAASIEASINDRFSNQTHSVLSQMIEGRAFEDLENLNHLNMPTFITANENDPIHPVSIAKKISMNIRNSQFHILPSRYLEPKKHQRELTNKLNNFLGSNNF
ncbi:MAG: alpha/beta hydrolase [Rhizobiales bacterium]|nr:alpha/beta hydrolase [Hyphomicrobiales bacterium]NRB15784.1 alpha/beta hydrolase [Hyphomicrobiales bacterium]